MTIKKTESEPDKQEDEKLSVCDIMKEDTSDIIKKMESQIPVMFQNYSNIYTQHLHSLDMLSEPAILPKKNSLIK